MSKKIQIFKPIAGLFNFLFNGTKACTSQSWSHFKSRPLEILGFVATMVALQQTYQSNNLTQQSNDMTQQSLVYSQKAMEQSDLQFKENNKGQTEEGRHNQEKHDSMMAI